MSDVIFVGTSDAFGAGGRRQSAIVVRGSSGTVLMDCGTTTGMGLRELGIELAEIDAILISHFHGDHFGGIPTLLLASLYEDQRKNELRIAGPPGIEEQVHRLAHAMNYNIEDRDWTFPIVFEELPAGGEREVGPMRVRSFPTHHQPQTHPHGLILDTGQDRIAYSGDTGWFDGLPGEVGSADLFICECTYRCEGFGLHLSHEGLTSHRHEFDCGRMILTHLGEDMVSMRDEIHDFDLADDGLVIRI